MLLSKNYIPIPQNKKKNFQIILANWKNSIDLLIENNEEIFLENLFIILKIYVNDTSLGLIKINIISYEKFNNKSLKCFSTVNIEKIKKFSFLDFEKWFESTYVENWKYINNNNNYGFRFTFNPHIQNFEKKKIYPEYPWNLNISNNNTIWNDEISLLKEKIKKLKEEIKKLQPK